VLVPILAGRRRVSSAADADARSRAELRRVPRDGSHHFAKKRFLTHRIAGLMEERHPGQKPTVITPQLQAKILEAMRCKPKDGETH
jgi:hypothetical protein